MPVIDFFFVFKRKGKLS